MENIFTRMHSIRNQPKTKTIRKKKHTHTMVINEFIWQTQTDLMFGVMKSHRALRLVCMHHSITSTLIFKNQYNWCMDYVAETRYRLLWYGIANIYLWTPGIMCSIRLLFNKRNSIICYVNCVRQMIPFFWWRYDICVFDNTDNDNNNMQFNQIQLERKY